MYNNRGVRRLTGVYDLGNRAYSEPLWVAVQAEFEQMGGDAGRAFPFASGEVDLQKLIIEVRDVEPEAILFIASPPDAALMAQYARGEGLTSRFFISSWALSDELLEKGGRAVEGIEGTSSYVAQNPRPANQAFLRRFRERYHREPISAAIWSYESVLVLAYALEQTGGKIDGLPQALLSVKNLEGIHGSITLDEYGDAIRDTGIAVVKDGQFVVTEMISMN